MRTEGRSTTCFAVALAATLLLWPVFWIRYPLVLTVAALGIASLRTIAIPVLGR